MQHKLSQNEALVQAAISNNVANVKQLVEAGADINALLKGDAALSWAAHNGNLELVDYLLKQGALVNVKDWRGNTPLHWAFYNGHEAVVKRLLLSNADKQAVNNNGLTPAEFALTGSKSKIKSLETVVLDMANEIKNLKQQVAAMQSQPSSHENKTSTSPRLSL